MRYLLLLLVFCVLLVSCSPEKEVERFTVTAYNVQNLMDAVLDGTEYEEYRPGGEWTEEAYAMRLKRLSLVLLSKPLRASDVFILEEVENERVVRDLVSRHLSRWGFGFYAVVKDPRAAIGIALISKAKPNVVRSHGTNGGRPVLEALYETPTGPIVVIGVHAKSQKGEGSEALRIECARTVRAIAKEHDDAAVLVAGDFNEDPDCSVGCGKQTALVLPDLASSSLFFHRGSLLVSGDRGRVTGDVWYDPLLDDGVEKSSQGTCCYEGVWHCYDQILAGKRLFDGEGWEAGDFSIFSGSLVLRSDGKPYAWDRKLLSGYSDHLPVTMSLVNLR